MRMLAESKGRWVIRTGEATEGHPFWSVVTPHRIKALIQSGLTRAYHLNKQDNCIFPSVSHPGKQRRAIRGSKMSDVCKTGQLCPVSKFTWMLWSFYVALHESGGLMHPDTLFWYYYYIILAIFEWKNALLRKSKFINKFMSNCT